MGFFSDFVEGFRMKPSEVRANLEKTNPGAGKRFDAWKQRDDSFKAATVQRRAKSNFNSDLLDPSTMVGALHLLAAGGAIEPKVAFSLGVPGSPSGTGKLVGPNGLYKG